MMVNNIVADVVGMMGTILDGSQLNRLNAVLTEVLSDYEITPRITDVAICEDGNNLYLMKFLAWKSTEGKSDRTIRQYRYALNQMLRTVGKMIPDITEDDLFLYMAIMKRNGCTNTYLKNVRSELSSFFGWLYNKGLICKNPISGISCIKTEKTIKKPFSDEEMEIMRRNIKSSKESAMFEFLYATGVRVSEFCALNLSDVDFSSKTVRVFGKGAKERIVPISTTAVWNLRQYLQERGMEEGALFVNRQKRRYKPSGVQGMLNRVSVRSGVKNIHPHRFRRTLATNLLKKGLQIEEVSKILGHSKLDTTMIYCQIDTEVVKNNYSRVMTA